jgi:hypothetical protein
MIIFLDILEKFLRREEARRWNLYQKYRAIITHYSIKNELLLCLY